MIRTLHCIPATLATSGIRLFEQDIAQAPDLFQPPLKSLFRDFHITELLVHNLDDALQHDLEIREQRQLPNQHLASIHFLFHLAIPESERVDARAQDVSGYLSTCQQFSA